MYLRNAILVALVAAMAAFAQSNPITADSPFQVRYAANTAGGESWINIVNTGANGAPLFGPGFGRAAGNICANVYAFSPDEQLISCCSCLITPNGVVNLGVTRDLTIKTLTPMIPTSVVVKLVSTLTPALSGTNNSVSVNGESANCTNSAALVNVVSAGGTTDFPVASGMAAWGTTIHAAPAGGYHTTESRFTPATLSAGELASITGRCAFILGNGGGFGICQSCRAGALGGVKK